VAAVIDLRGFQLSRQIHPVDFLKIVPRIFDAVSTSYPELLHRVIVINTPWSFTTFWNILIPFIPTEVREKIHIRYNWSCEKHLLPYFESDNVPAYLGGTLMGSDPGDEYCMDRLPGHGASWPEDEQSDRYGPIALEIEKGTDYRTNDASGKPE